MTEQKLPLSRFRVLDLTIARAGPTCVRVLADWGADVIRIEPPEGSGAGEPTGRRDGHDFQNLHRNKRAIALDLKSEDGKAIFVALAKTADVIVENMRVKVKYRLGIDYESVRKVNPRIIYASISGFGQEGPYAERPGFDQIAQGMGGLMSITGEPGRGPMRVGIPLTDLGAGAFLAQGVLIALLDREATGEGRWVQTSLLEAQLALLDFQAARWLMDGEVPGQEGNNHPTLMPTGVYETADGAINIGAAGQRIFERLCAVLEAPEIVADPRFREVTDRSRNRAALNEALNARTRHRTSAEWIEILNEAGVPSGPIYTIDQAFADPHVRTLGMSRKVVHPKLGEISLVAQPVTMSGYSKDLRSATPELGEHTEAVLAELGYDAAAIAALRDRHVI